MFNWLIKLLGGTPPPPGTTVVVVRSKCENGVHIAVSKQHIENEMNGVRYVRRYTKCTACGTVLEDITTEISNGSGGE